MNLRSHATTPSEAIAALPMIRQNAPAITRLRAELRNVGRLLAFGMGMGIGAVAWVLVGGGLMMTLIRVYPELGPQANQPGTPMHILMMLWFIVMPINFLVGLGLPAVLPFWFDWRMRGREAAFCDPQLIGDLIDATRAISSADRNAQKGWFAGCLPVWLTRTLPEISPQEAAALTDKQRDFLVERAFSWQSAQEEFALTVLRTAAAWGDLETLAALRMLSQTAESETIRTATSVSFAPLKARLLAEKEDAAMVNSLDIVSAPQYLW